MPTRIQARFADATVTHMSVWVLRRKRAKCHDKVVRVGKLIRVADVDKDVTGLCTVTFDTPSGGAGEKLVIKIAGVTANKRVKAVITRRFPP